MQLQGEDQGGASVQDSVGDQLTGDQAERIREVVAEAVRCREHASRPAGGCGAGWSGRQLDALAPCTIAGRGRLRRLARARGMHS
jgi:hypothetical protein